MKFWVSVKAGARQVGVEKAGEEYKVSVSEPPERGRANEAVLKALSEYLKIARFRFRVASGAAAKRKLIAVDE